MKWFFQGHASRHKSQEQNLCFNYQFRSPARAASDVQKKTKNLKNAHGLYTTKYPLLDLLPRDYLQQLAQNMACLYSQTRADTKDMSLSSKPFCHASQREDFMKKRMGCCCVQTAVSTGIQRLALFSLSLFLLNDQQSYINHNSCCRLFKVSCRNEETAAPVVVQPCLQSYTAPYVQVQTK